MVNVYKNTHSFLNFVRKDYRGNAITTQPTEIYFSVKENPDDANYLIQKTMTSGGIISRGNGEWQVQIVPADTKELSFGEYYCDVKVVDENGLNFIIVAPQPFNVLDTITLMGG